MAIEEQLVATFSRGPVVTTWLGQRYKSPERFMITRKNNERLFQANQVIDTIDYVINDDINTISKIHDYCDYVVSTIINDNRKVYFKYRFNLGIQSNFSRAKLLPLKNTHRSDLSHSLLLIPKDDQKRSVSDFLNDVVLLIDFESYKRMFPMMTSLNFQNDPRCHGMLKQLIGITKPLWIDFSSLFSALEINPEFFYHPITFCSYYQDEQEVEMISSLMTMMSTRPGAWNARFALHFFERARLDGMIKRLRKEGISVGDGSSGIYESVLEANMRQILKYTRSVCKIKDDGSLELTSMMINEFLDRLILRFPNEIISFDAVNDNSQYILFSGIVPSCDRPRPYLGHFSFKKNEFEKRIEPPFEFAVKPSIILQQELSEYFNDRYDIDESKVRVELKDWMIIRDEVKEIFVGQVGKSDHLRLPRGTEVIVNGGLELIIMRYHDRRVSQALIQEGYRSIYEYEFESNSLLVKNEMKIETAMTGPDDRLRYIEQMEDQVSQILKITTQLSKSCRDVISSSRSDTSEIEPKQRRCELLDFKLPRPTKQQAEIGVIYERSCTCCDTPAQLGVVLNYSDDKIPCTICNCSIDYQELFEHASKHGIHGLIRVIVAKLKISNNEIKYMIEGKSEKIETTQYQTLTFHSQISSINSDQTIIAKELKTDEKMTKAKKRRETKSPLKEKLSESETDKKPTDNASTKRDKIMSDLKQYNQYPNNCSINNEWIDPNQKATRKRSKSPNLNTLSEKKKIIRKVLQAEESDRFSVFMNHLMPILISSNDLDLISEVLETLYDDYRIDAIYEILHWIKEIEGIEDAQLPPPSTKADELITIDDVFEFRAEVSIEFENPHLRNFQIGSVISVPSYSDYRQIDQLSGLINVYCGSYSQLKDEIKDVVRYLISKSTGMGLIEDATDLKVYVYNIDTNDEISVICLKPTKGKFGSD